MKTVTKIACIVAIALFMLILAVFLVVGDTKLARWFYDDGGSTSEMLLKQATLAWSLDVTTYRYAGVRSTKGGVIVHRWEGRSEHQTEVIDVTSVDGLVCYSRRDDDSGQLRNVGCHHYSE